MATFEVHNQKQVTPIARLLSTYISTYWKSNKIQHKIDSLILVGLDHNIYLSVGVLLRSDEPIALQEEGCMSLMVTVYSDH